jgi:hypothetical protein
MGILIVDFNSKEIALTFDDGLHPQYRLQVLRILDSYNIKAGFFAWVLVSTVLPRRLKIEDIG